MVQYGKLTKHDYSSLRLVLFAGEVFPVKYLRRLKTLIPKPQYFNLYGPTETNVCTFYEIPDQIADDRSEPYPIGITPSHLKSEIVDVNHKAVVAGEEGELYISGDAVMPGYWNLPEQTMRALSIDSSGCSWFRTGDIVVEESDGNYRFVGRRDRMIKRRGYRVELGEIECCLHQHPKVCEAAVLAIKDEEEWTKVKAFVTTTDGKRLSLIQMKTFCASILPLYMVPDLFAFRQRLPKTSTGKVDYQKLREDG